MKKIIFILSVTCAFAVRAKAQVNYVLNPSFEQYSQCPTMLDQVGFAKYWNGIDTVWITGTLPYTAPACLPDYCNACSSHTETSIPINEYFYQNPRSGNGAVQVSMLSDSSRLPGTPDTHDYLQGRLRETLTAGKSYCITFYANLEEVSGYATDKIGTYLDDGSIDVHQDSLGCTRAQTTFHPQLYATTIINDTANWIKIQGNFTAFGNERFITIGNFFEFLNTNKIEVNYSSNSMYREAIYLIDDVSVIESSVKVNAGGDKLVSPGSDSAFIGTTDEGMPSTWYVLGSSTAIGYSGGIKVHPDVTTSYVVEMDLCGNITRDTVTVYVAPAGINSFGMFNDDVKISPNPAKDQVVVETPMSLLNGGEIRLFNMLGQEVYKTSVTDKKQTITISDFSDGVYILRVTDTSNCSVSKKLIKN